MDNQIIAALITVAGTLSGVLIGSILSRKASTKAIEASNKNATDLMERQEFNKAAAEFRVAFIKEQRLLDPQSFADRVDGNGVGSFILTNFKITPRFLQTF